jgi:hypothetical protein
MTNNASADPRTYFEDATHRAMLKMLSGADHQKVNALAEKLQDVATTVEGVGSDLKTHMSNLEWDSAAGDAFRSWGGDVANAAFKLSTYSQTAGDQMTHVASVLGQTVRDVPPVPQDAVNTAITYRQAKHISGTSNDAATGESATVCMPNPTTAQYQHAVTTMETERVKAVDAMTKLGSAYQGAAHSLRSQEEPSFPPMPSSTMPARPKDSRDSSSYASNGSAATANVPYTGAGVTSGGGGTHGGPAGGVSDGRTTTLGITGFPSGHQGTSTVTSGTHGPGAPSGTQPYPMPLSGGSATVPGTPGSTRSGAPGGEPEGPGGLPPEDGVIGGRPVSSVPIDDGIQGGQLITGGAAGVPGAAGRVRAPQSTVIGEEPATGGYGDPAGPAAGYGGANGSYAQGGSAAGASESEGIQGGAGGRMMGGGMGMGMGGAGGAAGGRRRGGQRPGYLTEDEETWTPDDQKVVPSVLE